MIDALIFAFYLALAALILTIADQEPAHAESRSPRTVREFKHVNPCPVNGKRYGTCPGYIVDHIMPLGCGGADDVRNMQWQTKLDATLKDKWEIRGDAKHPPCSGLAK